MFYDVCFKISQIKDRDRLKTKIKINIIFIMGQLGSYKKDGHVDIYFETSKPFYMAGEQVEGSIHINVHTDSEYNALYIKLEGHQYCRWIQRRDDRTYQYKNSKETYRDEFMVQKFGSIIYNGQYTFPFAFVLPLSMSGSFFMSADNYIKYSLTAYLACFSKKNDNQPFVINLNVREIPKVPKGITQSESLIEGKCCGCCTDYGVTKVAIKCDRNVLNTMEQSNIEVFFDNSNGFGQIENVSLALVNHHIMTSSEGLTNYSQSKQYLLNSFGAQSVMPGATQYFKSSPFIPGQIRRETAIGAITASWFEIVVRGSLGCCNFNPPQARLRIFLYSSSLALLGNQKVQKPLYWDPKVGPLVFNPNMKPFIYQPCQALLLLNLNNTQVFVNTGNQMGSNINIGMPPSFELNRF